MTQAPQLSSQKSLKSLRTMEEMTSFFKATTAEEDQHSLTPPQVMKSMRKHTTQRILLKLRRLLKGTRWMKITKSFGESWPDTMKKTVKKILMMFLLKEARHQKKLLQNQKIRDPLKLKKRMMTEKLSFPMKTLINIKSQQRILNWKRKCWLFQNSISTKSSKRRILRMFQLELLVLFESFGKSSGSTDFMTTEMNFNLSNCQNQSQIWKIRTANIHSEKQGFYL